MLPYLDIIYILISTITLAAYSILIKKITIKETLIVLFWLHTLTYLGFFAIYLFRTLYLQHDLFAIEQLIHNYTFYDAPLYILYGISFLGSFLLFNKLIIGYPVSQVLPFAQISLLFTMIGYLLLGDPFSWAAFCGVIIVCIGAMISVIEDFHWPNVLKSFTHLPRALVIGILLESFLITLKALITFFITQKTPIDEYIMGSLKHVYPFSFHDPFFFNLGARFFVMITFFVYLFEKREYRGKIISTLTKNFWQIGILSLVYLISAYTYQDAYRLTLDKNILAALSKLNVPLVLIFSTIFLGEELNLQKIIGSLLILIGGIIAVFF